MPELRFDPLNECWTIFAEERAGRPRQFDVERPKTVAPNLGVVPDCPFCPGHERETPPEVLAYRDLGSESDGPGWRVRAFPNLYPVVSPRAALGRLECPGVHERRGGYGAHEVIVECPRHVRGYGQMSVVEVQEAFRLIRERVLALSRDPRLAHALAFKNSGGESGASLEHTHSQLVALPHAPRAVAIRERNARRFYESQGGTVSIYDAILDQEREDGRRIVRESPLSLAFCPFASRFACEVWIVPKRGPARFEESTPELLDDMAEQATMMVRTLELALDNPAYNLIVETAPFDRDPRGRPRSGSQPHERWRLVLLPRLGRIAGFEWGSGEFINIVAPETAAALLKNAAATLRCDANSIP